MKIFISSVIGGFESYRDAVDEAVGLLGHEIIRAESFPASADSPQVACLKGIRQSDLVILIVGQRYGEIQKSGFSATHEEFLEAKDSKPILAFIESDVVRDDMQSSFLKNVQSWSSGRYTNDFSSEDELKKNVVTSLHEFIVSMSTAEVDIDALSERAKSRLSEANTRNYNGAFLELSLTVGPTQTIIRPAKIAEAELTESIIKLAALGRNRIFSISNSTNDEIRNEELNISQKNGAIRINSQGDIVVRVDIQDISKNSSVIIEEYLKDKILKILLFCSELLDRLDSTHKVSYVSLFAQLHGANHYGWQTIQENQNSNGTHNIFGFGNNNSDPVGLSPSCFKRGTLKFDAPLISDDILALLKRAHRGS